FLLRALIQKALILDQTGQRPGALATLLEAVDIAAPEKIRMPFSSLPALQGLLHAAQKRAREEAADLLIQYFIASCLDDGADISGHGGNARSLFSPREYEVVLELMQGHTNKEIARALDLTEHTVKFHL